MQVLHLLDYNGSKLIIKRTIKEHKLKPGFNIQILKKWTMSDTILKKDGVYYCCETIQEANIIS